MSRLGKKCFFASTALHLLLTGVLLVGVAFHTRDSLTSKEVPPPMLIEKVSDAPTQMKGGSPEPKPAEASPAKAAEPAAALPKLPTVEKLSVKPPAPPPEVKTEITPPEVKVEVPKAEKHPKPVDKKAEVKPAPEKAKPVRPKVPPATHTALRKDLPADEPAKISKTKPNDREKPAAPKGLEEEDLKIQHRTSTIVTKPTKPKPSKPSAEEVAQYTAAHEAYVQAKATAQIVGQLSGSIGKSTSSPILKLDSNPGTGGDSVAESNYSDLVYSKYNAAWDPSADIDDEKASVIACIQISPDGRVISREITQKSGNRLMDRSIQSVLDRVNFIEPFPAGADKKPRTYYLRFNLQTKRSFG